MNIAVLSDAHGNYPALQAVLADLEDFQAERIIFAGDFLRGPFPNEVVETLRECGACMIRGNDDMHPLRYIDRQVPEEWRTMKQFRLTRWTAEHLSPENAAFLRSLPEQEVIHIPGTQPIRVVHGSPRSPNETIEPDRKPEDFRLSLQMIAEPVLLCGHTHRQWCCNRHGKLALNPGSVSGTEIGGRTQYARLTWNGEGWQVDLRVLAYDLTALQKAFVERGLLAENEPMARGFLLSMETGHDFLMGFLRYAYRLAGAGSQVIPDEVWERAEETFDWG